MGTKGVVRSDEHKEGTKQGKPVRLIPTFCKMQTTRSMMKSVMGWAR